MTIVLQVTFYYGLSITHAAPNVSSFIVILIACYNNHKHVLCGVYNLSSSPDHSQLFARQCSMHADKWQGLGRKVKGDERCTL